MPLIDRLKARRAKIGIVGLGYAGLPMAVEIASAGFPVVGFDVDESKISAVNEGRSPVSDVPSTSVAELRAQGRLRATADFDLMREMDAAIICVPTPLTHDRQPDLRFVESAALSIAQRLHPEMMVILQSTCAPGTTRGVLLPILESAGLRVGEDYHVVFAPERIDPGNARYNVKNTPKLVGGITQQCTELAETFFRQFIDEVVSVSSADVAEMSKLMENTFRFINISFVNEMALLCDRLGINIWEVIQAASTKPFAFMPHYPSAGVGGHCIPVVPLYLEAIAREHGMVAQLIEVSAQINDEMPRMIVRKIREILAEDGRVLTGSRVLLLGVTYKADIADTRESAALRVFGELVRQGAEVGYHDPLIRSVVVNDEQYLSQPVDPAMLSEQDCVVILTPHSTIDFDLVAQHARIVVDTRSGISAHESAHVFNVWRPRRVSVPSVV